MIVIKTKLNKIPESCTKCPYSDVWDDARFCSVSFKRGDNRLIPYEFVPERKNWCYIKPDWCPLKEMEETK